MDSPRIDRAKKVGRDILERVTAGEGEMTAFDEFALEITTCLRSIVRPDVNYRSFAAKREKLWTAFHQIRLSEVPNIWDNFLSSQHMQPDQYFQQSVTQTLFEKLLLSEFSSISASSRQCPNAEDNLLSTDELNALQYACGYVPHTLLKRFQKRCGRKYDQFIECLGEMAVQNKHDDDDFLAYTRQWIDKVNRGGLFPLNDGTFQFASKRRFRFSFLVIWLNDLI